MFPIIACTDFSKHSFHALSYAAELACDLKSELHLIFVNERPGLKIEDTFSAGEEEALSAERERLHELVREFQNKYKSLRIGAKIVHAGKVTEGILHAAREFGAGLTIIGSTSTNRVERFIMGSTVSGLIGATHTSLLIVPPEQEYKKWERILIATDMSESNLDATLRLIPIASHLTAEMRYIYIDSDGIENGSDFVREMVHSLRAKTNYPKLSGFMIRSSELEHGLDRFLHSHRADLLVMMTRVSAENTGRNSESKTIHIAEKLRLPLWVER